VCLRKKGALAPTSSRICRSIELNLHVERQDTRTETNEATGEESERDIPFMKGYTVFNVEQVEGLPASSR
jgi:antirestriction protein ArdC